MFTEMCLCLAVQLGQPASGEGQRCLPIQPSPLLYAEQLSSPCPCSLPPAPLLCFSRPAARSRAIPGEPSALTFACFRSRAAVVVRASADGAETRRAVRRNLPHAQRPCRS